MKSACRDTHVREYPTGPITTSEPRNQEVVEFNIVLERRTMDFEVVKRWVGYVARAVAI